MRRALPLMRGRDAELSTAIGLVQAGLTVDVVGNRSSGRTTFLAELQSELETHGWNVVMVRGVASLREFAYAALHLADIGSPSSVRDRSTIQVTVAALRDLLDKRSSAVLIDDWDDLDETSWGIIEAVRRQTGFALVRARLRGTTDLHTPTGLASATLDPAFVIKLPPLSLDILEAVIADYLDGPIEISTIGRIYEKSGGSVGLALSIVDAALREGLIRRSPDGFWTANGGIWSDSLRGIVEAHLIGISPEARRALETVASVGVAELETVRQLVDWEALEDLEMRGLFRLLNTGSGRLINISPPLLVDYFRHDEHPLRHIRLTEFIAERLGTDASELRFLQNEAAPTVREEEHGPLLRAMLVDRSRTRQLVAHAEWERGPSPAAAVRYIAALISSGAPAETVDQVIHETDRELGDAKALADFTIAEARWRAAAHDDLDGALALLEHGKQHVGSNAPLLEVEAISLTCQLKGIPDNWDELLAITGNESPALLFARHEVRLMVLVAMAKFEQATTIFEELEHSAGRDLTPMIRLFGYMARAGLGELDTAVLLLRRAWEEVTETLDIEAIQIFGAGLVSVLNIQGDLGAVEGILQRVFTLGYVAPIPLVVYDAVLSTATRTAFRRGDSDLGAHRAASARTRSHTGELLGVFTVIPAVQDLLRQGMPSEAAEVLWDDAERLWNKGAHMASAFGMIVSLEVQYHEERFQIASARKSEIEGPLLDAPLDYIAALEAKHPERLVAAAEAAIETGRYGIALHMLRLAAVLHTEQRDAPAALEATEKKNELLASLGPRVIESSRFFSTTTSLSDREREIARLASQGMTNQDIATSLVLSVRTVESHMYHALRKLGLNSRQSLKHFADIL